MAIRVTKIRFLNIVNNKKTSFRKFLLTALAKKNCFIKDQAEMRIALKLGSKIT